jgi:hypothetical protein
MSEEHVAEEKSANVVEKSSFDGGRPPSEESAKATKMTTKRFMALFSLVWLITTSATPILFIASTLCTRSLFIPPSRSDVQPSSSPTSGEQRQLPGLRPRVRLQ